MRKVYAFYSKETNTIRHAPTNVCLIYFKDGSIDYEVDGASKPVRNMLRKTVLEYGINDLEKLTNIISIRLSRTKQGKKLIWADI